MPVMLEEVDRRAWRCAQTEPISTARSVAAVMRARCCRSWTRTGRLLVMDRDPQAIAAARREFGARCARRDPARQISRTWPSGRRRDGGLDGVLLDLGVSSPQLDDAQRGFSFRADAPLDMRMDPSQRRKRGGMACASASEAEIADVLWKYGEERMSRRIARAIVARRAERRRRRDTANLPNSSRASSADRDPASIRRRARSRRLRIAGQRRTRRARTRSPAAACPAAAGRALSGDQLPFAGRPHRQTFHPRRSRHAADAARLAAAARDRTAAASDRQRAVSRGDAKSRATRARAAPCCAWQSGSRQ